MLDPRLAFLESLPYCANYLGGATGRHRMIVRELFDRSLETYLAIEATADPRIREPRLNENMGSFSVSQVKALLPWLGRHVSGDVLSFYHPFYLAAPDAEVLVTALAYRSELAEVPEIMQLPENDFSPTLWWPEGREWFLLNDFGGVCGIFGGSAALAAELREALPFRVLCVEGQQTLEEVDSLFWSSVPTIDQKVFG